MTRKKGGSTVVVCQNPDCGKQFKVSNSRLATGGGKYCCKACQFSKSREERFWELVDKNGPTQPHEETRCWVFTASRNSNGNYGQFWNGERNVGAHRYSWELHNGEIPKGMNICHHCDHSICIRPSHLFLGTQKDNLHDMKQKGRDAVVGEKNAQAKLTRKDVRDIRKMYATGNYIMDDLAEEFDVSRSLICNVVNVKIWKHVKEKSAEYDAEGEH